MESKSVIVSVLLMSLMMAQIQVEAKSCCPSTTARNIYNSCRLTGASRSVCASLSGCKIVDGTCPAGYDKITLQTDGSMTLASEAQNQKMEELYSRISAAIESYDDRKPTHPTSCLPLGSPCAGLQGGNCCSNNCVFFIIGIPVGVCGTA